MSIHYGQNIVYGVLGSPTVFSGDKLSFTYRDTSQGGGEEGQDSEYVAYAIHSRKGEIEIAGEVTSATNDFLDISGGSALAMTGSLNGVDLTSGFILCSEVDEAWSLLRRMQVRIRASHYIEAGAANGATAGKTINSFTPAQSLDFLFPGNEIIYSTAGLSHDAGIVHELRISQRVSIVDDQPSPTGKILGAFTHGYTRTISATILVETGASVPQVRDVFNITGAPDRGLNMRVTNVSQPFERKSGLMLQVEGVWIPAMGTGVVEEQ